MKEHEKVLCQCAAGRCFLEEDEARAKQNYANTRSENGLRNARLLSSLEYERLRQKNEWMENLGVWGIRDICCRKETCKSAPDHQD